MLVKSRSKCRLAKRGRPSKFDDKLATKICDRIADGETLRTICAEPAMPSRSTVHQWLRDYEEFQKDYAVSMKLRSDSLVDEMLDVARNVTPETVNAVKVHLSVLKWLSPRLNPKKYHLPEAAKHVTDPENPVPRALTSSNLQNLIDAYTGPDRRGVSLEKCPSR